MKHDWSYANSETCKVGRMICTACKQPILIGQFRYRETEEAYLPQHRHCSLNDKQWRKLDTQDVAYEEYHRRRQLAYDKFVAEFGVPDDLIDCE